MHGACPHDRFDLARREMARCEHGHAPVERQPRDEGDLPEPVAVLEKERLAVDLDQLSAVGGCRGHEGQYRVSAARALVFPVA